MLYITLRKNSMSLMKVLFAVVMCYNNIAVSMATVMRSSNILLNKNGDIKLSDLTLLVHSIANTWDESPLDMHYSMHYMAVSDNLTCSVYCREIQWDLL